MGFRCEPASRRRQRRLCDVLCQGLETMMTIDQRFVTVMGALRTVVHGRL